MLRASVDTHPELYVSDIGYSFFFSSRRRHTRLQGDWSSDVCSSDLLALSVSREVVQREWPSDFTEEEIEIIEKVLPYTDRKSVRVGKECRSRWSPYH